MLGRDGGVVALVVDRPHVELGLAHLLGAQQPLALLLLELVRLGQVARRARVAAVGLGAQQRVIEHLDGPPAALVEHLDAVARLDAPEELFGV